MLDQLVRSARDEYSRYSLPETLRLLNQAWRAGKSGVDAFRIDSLSGIEPSNEFWSYAVAETARLVLLWSLDAVPGLLCLSTPRSEQLSHLMGTALEIRGQLEAELINQHPSEGVASLLTPIVLSQWQTQGLAYEHFPRAVLLLRDAPRQREARLSDFDRDGFDQLIRTALGGEPLPFLRSVHALAGNALTHSHLSSTTYIAESHRAFERSTGNAVAQLATHAALNTMSATPKEFRRELGQDASALRCPNPLLNRPWVRVDSDKYIAPCPTLVTKWLYEPFMDLLFRACRDQTQRCLLDDTFEEYVGLLLTKMVTDANVIPESDLRNNRQGVVDWVVPLQRELLLIEVKRSQFPDILRRSPDAAGVSLLTTLGKTIDRHRNDSLKPGQIDSFVEAIRSGRIPRLYEYRTWPVFACVVMYGEADIATTNSQWLSEKGLTANSTTREGHPVKVVSIVRLERALHAWCIDGDQSATRLMSLLDDPVDDKKHIHSRPSFLQTVQDTELEAIDDSAHRP